jgi:hypothetical protein
VGDNNVVKIADFGLARLIKVIIFMPFWRDMLTAQLAESSF